MFLRVKIYSAMFFVFFRDQLSLETFVVKSLVALGEIKPPTRIDDLFSRKYTITRAKQY